jgi:hypothetical protein
MSRFPQRLDGLTTDQRARVLSHPWQQETVGVVTRLIERLRAADTWQDFYELQRQIFGGLHQTEERFAKASRNAKRMARGRTVEPAETADWQLDRLVYLRVGRQIRSVGDALAWKLFGHDRQVITALSQNQQPGPMFGKEGILREVGEVKAAWEKEGVFALLNDATGCVRIGDVTKFYEGRVELVEVKIDPTKVRRDQTARMERVVATMNEGAPLIIDGHPVEVIRVQQPFSTHLPKLAEAFDGASNDGFSALSLGPGWVVNTTNLVAAVNNTPAEEVGMLFERQQLSVDQAVKEAGLDEPKHTLHATRSDRIDQNPTAAPFAIYPFDPETCALLTCDFLTYESTMSWERLSAGFEEEGFVTKNELPDRGEMMEPDVPVITASKEDMSVLLRAGAIEQIVLELVEPQVYAAAMSELFQLGRSIPAGLITFANETETWR